jgi:hypothetical protein
VHPNTLLSNKNLNCKKSPIFDEIAKGFSFPEWLLPADGIRKEYKAKVPYFHTAFGALKFAAVV